MAGKLRVAWLLLAIFALQAGASAAASAAGPDCCPAMAAATSEAPAPCRTLSSVGCCEERTAAGAAEVFVPPGHALAAFAGSAPARLAPRTVRPAAAPEEPAARALRGTILRL